MNQSEFWDRFVDGVIRWRIVIVTAFSLAMIVFGVKVGENITNVDNSLKMWFKSGDSDYAFYNQFKEEFESDEMIMVSVAAPSAEGDVFTPRMLGLIEQIGEALEGVVNIEEVQSLVTQNQVRGQDGALIIEPVVDLSNDLTADVLDRARRRALSEETFVGFLVSEDGKVASVAGRIIATESKPLKKKIVADVQTVLDPIKIHYQDVAFYLTGSPVFDVEFDDMAVRDGETFLPVTLGLVSLVLFVLFRRPGMAILPVLLMFAVITYTWGTYFFLGNTMNMAFNMSGSILVAVCIADAVHIIGHYYGVIEPGMERTQAIKTTVRAMARPCFFTSVTTAAGFLSFGTSDVVPIQQLGIYSGIGCLLAFVATVVFIPALLSLLPMPSARKSERYREGIISTFLVRLGHWTSHHTGQVMVIAGILLVLAIAGMSRVRVEGNSLEYIPKDNPIREAVFFLQEHLGGLASFEVILEGDADLAKDPAFLNKIDHLQGKILEDPQVSNSFSHINYLKDINRTLHDGDAAYDRVPETPEMVAQYLLLAETSGDEDIARFVNYDYSKVRVTSRSPAMLSNQYLHMMDRVSGLLGDLDLGTIGARVTGLVPLYAKFDRLILQSQIRSLALAFFTVYVFMTVLMRSWKIGLLSMIPNGLPIFITLSIMGYADLSLDAATVMIAGIALGIAVDDTVHYLSRFRAELDRTGWDYEEAGRRATRIVGRPIVYTSVILLAGFGVLILGSFRPTRLFGFLTGLTMILALVGDLVLLPALLFKLRPWGTGPVSETTLQEGALATGHVQEEVV